MGEFFRLKGIDMHLQRVINPVSFFDINPSNIDEERERVLRDHDHNPLFTYPEVEFDFDDIQQRLHEIDEHDSPMGALLNEKRNLFIDKCEMLNNRGTPKFSVFARKVYGLPSRDVLDKAVSFFSLDSEKEPKVLSSRQAAGMLQAEINHYGFPYEVGERVMSSSAMVLVAKRRIFVRKGFSFSDNFVRRLITHEIGTHVLRAENGREQPFMMFFHGFPDYLKTEEGLAVVNEERFGLLNNDNMKNYAARAMAVKMAMTKSFSKIFNYLLEFFSPRTAFKIALRAKRGIADTSKPGGCPKDYVYIDGYLKVKEYLESGGSIRELYYGKVDIGHLHMIEEIPGINPPKYLPKNQTFKSLLSF